MPEYPYLDQNPIFPLNAYRFFDRKPQEHNFFLLIAYDLSSTILLGEEISLIGWPSEMRSYYK